MNGESFLDTEYRVRRPSSPLGDSLKILMVARQRPVGRCRATIKHLLRSAVGAEESGKELSKERSKKMEKNEIILKQKTFVRKQPSLRWSGLQRRMTITYALTTLAAVLFIEILIVTTIGTLLSYGPLAVNEFVNGARQTARTYALAASVQAGGEVLDPQTTFEPNRPSSIALPDDNRSGSSSDAPYVSNKLKNAQIATFALLIAPDGHILASSYPAQYPSNTPAAQLLPSKVHLINNALVGRSGNAVDWTAQGRIVSVVEPVWSREKKPIGAIYLQIPGLSAGGLLPGFASVVVISGLFWLLVTLLVGGIFGLISTRGLVRRIRHLVMALMHFADGDYTQRVHVSRKDEVGQLEEQFNWMAQQLVESTTQRQALAGQNARMAERDRLARDLHDSVKQQVFAVSMQLGAALSLLDQQRDVARQHLEQAESLAYEVQQELTTLIQELRPLALQDKELSVALQDFVKAWSHQQGIAVDLHISDTCMLPLTIEEALWRVTQEAFSNIARHSQATEVQLSLECAQAIATLSIKDNGRGFDNTGTNTSGVGLHSMQERIEALGGTFTVESKVGEGTRILAQCPYVQIPASPSQQLRQEAPS